MGLLLWPLGYILDIHSWWYFAFANVVSGIFQATGWPAVVAVMSRWFASTKRGLIMGVWNSHTSIGNVLGSVICTAALGISMDGYAWPWAFAVPSLISLVFAAVVYFFLIGDPLDVGIDVKAIEAEHVRDSEAVSITNKGVPLSDDKLSDGDNGIASPSEQSTGRPRTLSSSGRTYVAIPRPQVLVNETDANNLLSPSTTSTSSGNNNGHNASASSAMAVTTYGSVDNASEIHVTADGYDNYGSDADGQVLEKPKPVTFCTALLIPGVIEYSFALFFCKLVAYTFLFWLPDYLISVDYDKSVAGYLSAWFDVGGIVGGILAGYLSDRTRKPAIISVVSMVLCMPILFSYRSVSGDHVGGMFLNAFVMAITGAFVNGPYALITTAVSADLGSHPQLGNDASALATVTGIVDGMGSAGAALCGVTVSLIARINAPANEDNWYVNVYSDMFLHTYIYIYIICYYISM